MPCHTLSREWKIDFKGEKLRLVSPFFSSFSKFHTVLFKIFPTTAAYGLLCLLIFDLFISLHEVDFSLHIHCPDC